YELLRTYLCLSFEALERVAAGPAEMRRTAQRGTERALQDGVAASAEGARRPFRPRQRGQGHRHRPLPTLSGGRHSVRSQGPPTRLRDPVTGPGRCEHETDANVSCVRHGSQRRLDVLPDHVQGRTANEGRKEIHLHGLVEDAY